MANPNPLGAALALMLGAGAAMPTAWQQAVVAAVFELCLVGVMVAFELLGHGREPASAQAAADGARPAQKPTVDAAAQALTLAALPALHKTRAKASSADQAGKVKGFFRDYIFPAEEGERVDIKTMVDTYRGWCAGKGLTPVDLDTLP